MTIQDKIRGSLIGGAVGDALGYPVEFISSYQMGVEAKVMLAVFLPLVILIATCALQPVFYTLGIVSVTCILSIKMNLP